MYMCVTCSLIVQISVAFIRLSLLSPNLSGMGWRQVSNGWGSFQNVSKHCGFSRLPCISRRASFMFRWNFEHVLKKFSQNSLKIVRVLAGVSNPSQKLVTKCKKCVTTLERCWGPIQTILWLIRDKNENVTIRPWDRGKLPWNTFGAWWNCKSIENKLKIAETFCDWIATKEKICTTFTQMSHKFYATVAWHVCKLQANVGPNFARRSCDIRKCVISVTSVWFQEKIVTCYFFTTSCKLSRPSLNTGFTHAAHEERENFTCVNIHYLCNLYKIYHIFTWGRVEYTCMMYVMLVLVIYSKSQYIFVW